MPAQVRKPTSEESYDEHTHRVLANTSAAAVWHSGFPHNTIKPANADKSKEGGKKGRERWMGINLGEDGIIEFSMVFRRFQDM